MKTSSLEILYVKELTPLLGLTDPRSAKRWCGLNGVAILTDRGRRTAYVVRSDYEAARTREFIRALKQRHGTDWLTAYEAHVNFDIELLSGLRDVSRVDRYAEKSSVIPLSETSIHASKFRDRLLGIITFTSEK